MKKFLEFVKKHKKAVIIIAIVAVVAVLAIKIAKTVKDAQNLLAGMQNSASTEKIEERDIVNSVTATGTIVAVEERTFSTSVTGVKVKEVNVKVGDSVNAGDILCVLDEEDFEKQLADAKTQKNADAGRANIDLQASDRGLNEAVTTRDISAQRAEEDKNNAYQDFSSAADECQEAEDAYNDASKKTSDAKDAMNKTKEALEAARKIKPSEVDATARANAIVPYNEELDRLDEYITSVKNDPSKATEAGLIPDDWKTSLIADLNNDKWSIDSISVSTIYNGDDSEITTKISSEISELKSRCQQYKANLDYLRNKDVPDTSSLEAAYQQAKAAYEAAQATEESKKSIYDSKVKNVESLYDAFNQTVRSADDSKRSNDSAVASRVDSVKNSRLSASTATLSDNRNIESLEEKIEGCVVSSSIGGIVTKVDVTAGDMYAGGAMVTVENTSAYEVAAQIDEYDIAKVKEGQEVVIKTNGTGSLELKGTVKSIAPHATASTNLNSSSSSGVKYEVRVSVLTPCEDLKLDMTAKIEIICEKSEGVLAVPTEAIQEDEDGNFFVEILDKGEPVDTSKMLTDPESVSKEDTEKLQSGEKNYESHNVYITKGLEGDYYTEISGEGLEAGMRIVVPNNGAFSDISEYMDEAGAMGGF